MLGGKLYKNTEHYGDLDIATVNGEPAEQYVRTTPKFHFPGGQPGTKVDYGHRLEDYDFPASVAVTEKLDGTNIYLYPYADASGDRRVGVKTRLMPTPGKFWGKVERAIEAQPRMFQYMVGYAIDTGSGVGFELHGKHNRIYFGGDDDPEIGLAPLYSIAPDGSIAVCRDAIVETREVGSAEEYWDLYDKCVKVAQERGLEGHVLYVLDRGAEPAGRFLPALDAAKCKPLEHISPKSKKGGNPTLAIAEIRTIAKNALETIEFGFEDPSADMALYRDEFSSLVAEEDYDDGGERERNSAKNVSKELFECYLGEASDALGLDPGDALEWVVKTVHAQNPGDGHVMGRLMGTPALRGTDGGKVYQIVSRLGIE